MSKNDNSSHICSKRLKGGLAKYEKYGTQSKNDAKKIRWRKVNHFVTQVRAMERDKGEGTPEIAQTCVSFFLNDPFFNV